MFYTDISNSKIPTEIIKSPQDTTVFPDQKSMFTCEVNVTFHGWKVNGTGFSSLPPEIRNNLTRLTKTVGNNELITLIIPGRVIYNETTVQCVAAKEILGDEVESENASLTIQGIFTPFK